MKQPKKPARRLPNSILELAKSPPESAMTPFDDLREAQKAQIDIWIKSGGADAAQGRLMLNVAMPLMIGKWFAEEKTVHGTSDDNVFAAAVVYLVGVVEHFAMNMIQTDGDGKDHSLEKTSQNILVTVQDIIVNRPRKGVVLTTRKDGTQQMETLEGYRKKRREGKA